MTTLAEKIGERHVWPYDPLAASAEYVEKQLAASGYAVMRQEFLVGERGVANTEVVITGRSHAEGFDLPDRLDYAATARVVTGLCHVILDLAGT